MDTLKKSQREVVSVVKGMATSDGDGVKMTRVIASPELDMLDPFLMLDHFESDDSKDYMGGFPSHPHRGFETVTYMLAGKMRHKDSMGNEGVISSNGVQWMTAGRGVIHSEMPEQEEGLMSGFQLWVNLPKEHKMTAPAYQEFPDEGVPVQDLAGGGSVRVIAGTTAEGTVGPVVNKYVDAIYLHLSLPAGAVFEQAITEGHNAFVYIIEGSLQVGSSDSELKKRTLGVLSPSGEANVKAGPEGSDFLLVAGRPLNEPVARQGPFVMNTQQELQQAFYDYQSNQFA